MVAVAVEMASVAVAVAEVGLKEMPQLLLEQPIQSLLVMVELERIDQQIMVEIRQHLVL